MKLNNKLLAQMRAATRHLMHRHPLDTSKVIEDALRNASAMTQAAQEQMRNLSPLHGGVPPGPNNTDMHDMLAELSRNLGSGLGSGFNGAAANEPAPLLPGSFSDGSYTNAAGTRSYKLYVPSTYGGTPAPLVVMLHGCTQDPDDFAKGTQMNMLAEEMGLSLIHI